MAETKKKAAAVETAEETTETAEAAETTEATENTSEAAEEKMVIVKIPRDRNDKEQEDVFVGVNERTWLIKRGVEVKVPECVAEVLRHKDEMLDIISEFESAHGTA